MDAALSRIESGIQQLRSQSEEIKAHVEKTNGRVGKLEGDRIKIYTIATTIATSATIAWQWITHRGG